jgi:uroporphyrinogen-III decarboxylase
MIPRERLLAALDRKFVDCVPFVETSVAFGISEKLLGRRLGNVNVDTLTSGTPEKTYGETRELIRDLAPGYGYVLSSINSIPEYAQPENVLALARALEDFGAYQMGGVGLCKKSERKEANKRSVQGDAPEGKG